MTGSGNVGGFIYKSFSDERMIIENCYTACNMSGCTSINKGGFIHIRNYMEDYSTNSFWDKTLSGIEYNIEYDASAKTTSELKSESTFLKIINNEEFWTEGTILTITTEPTISFTENKFINEFTIPYFQVWYKNQMNIIPEEDMKYLEIHFITKDNDYTILYDDISFLGKTETDRIDYNDYCILCTVQLDENSKIINLIEKQETYLEPFNYISRQTIPDYAGDNIRFVINCGIINENGSLNKKW